MAGAARITAGQIARQLGRRAVVQAGSGGIAVANAPTLSEKDKPSPEPIDLFVPSGPFGHGA